MALSTVAFSTMHVLIRYLSREIDPIQIAFFRNFFGLVVFAPWIAREGLGIFRTQRLPLHLLRSALNVVAMFMYFTALSLAPVARVTALAFTAPIFAALVSVLLLKEKFYLRRWSALIIGFIGTLIILRPGLVAVDQGSLLVLASAMLWGVTLIVIKVLGRTESSITITAYMNLLLAALAFIPALMVWTTPSLEGWMWLVLIAVTGTVGQVMVAQSLKEADAGTVMPFDFLKLIWVAVLGYWIFAEAVDLFTWLGAAVVFGAGVFLTYREAQVSKDPVLTQSNGRPT